MIVRRLPGVAWLLALSWLVLVLDAPAERLIVQANIAPSAFGYLGNAAGRELPLFWKPRFRDLPIAFYPDGTRVEILSSVVRGEGHRWVRVRGPNGLEAWALTRTLKPNPPLQDAVRRGDYPTFSLGPTWPGRIAFCMNPVGMPAAFTVQTFQDAVGRAIRLWQSAAAADIPIDSQGLCKRDPKNHKDGFSVIGWGRPRTEDGKRLFGASYTRASGSKIVESDILLDAVLLSRRALSPPWLADRNPANCLSQTIAHEIGHMLGLTHAPEDVVSVMRPHGICLRVTQLPAADVFNVRLRY